MLPADRASGIDWADLSQLQSIGPQPVAIHRQITPATSGTTLDHHFWFSAATAEYGRNRLSQPRTFRICRVTPSTCLTGHTLESGKVGSVFEHLPTWWLIGESNVSEWSPIRVTQFFDEFRLLDLWLIDSKRFPPWR